MKHTAKTAFHRGFTLIELMIVIVIIGILTISFFPSFSGSRERAQDSARANDLRDLAVGLETYLSDYNVYPGTTGTPVCLKSGGANYDFGNAFDTYFQNGVITPDDPKETITIGNFSCEGGYIYLPAINKGQDPGSYALIANIQTATQGNLIPSGFNYGATTTLADLNAALITDPDQMIQAENNQPDGSDTAYMLIK